MCKILQCIRQRNNFVFFGLGKILLHHVMKADSFLCPVHDFIGISDGQKHYPIINLSLVGIAHNDCLFGSLLTVVVDDLKRLGMGGFQKALFNS